ncbi:TolC family outer membrane protein [Roseiterribacter gracilis]|uniref:Type I secretion protein TolC n=1 Tax=Roseiterribacter gracilis TaxID=2812848 RepID=A0A8S8X9T8_9PROT|nr:type I secretion protein TolC [Rhodospirillales bacterium TMPK1]
MKLHKAILSAVLTTGLLVSIPASAETLQEALAMSYARNPDLDSARALLRATDELVPQAQAGWRPTVTLSANAQRSYTNEILGGDATHQRFRFWNSGQSVAVQIVQPLFRGGRTAAQISRASNSVQQQRQSLKATEQQVLLAAATSYLDVARDQAVLELNRNNESNLQRQLQASRDRFRVGEITRTDVSLSESRFSRATADKITAAGQLNASRATYQRVVGEFPKKIVQENFTFPLPKSLEEAVELAETQNPNVLAAEYAERASRDNIDDINGSRLPQVNAVGTVSRNWAGNTGNPLSAPIARTDNATFGVQATWQLYSGGLVSSQVRQAKQQTGQRLLELESQKRLARENAIRAWEGLQASRAAIVSRKTQVEAANLALEGTRQEALVGSKTVLDTLDAEQEALNAQTDLVRVQHDEQVAAFQLLAAIGRLTGPDLGLAVAYYDANRNYDRVKNKLFGTDIGE